MLFNKRQMNIRPMYKRQTGQQQIAQTGRHQQGFVLILALVMLAVLTLIGVSSMNSASIELKAAANAQQQIVAFNGVQSVLAFTLSQPAETAIGWTSTDDEPRTATHSVPSAANLVANVDYLGCSIGIGSSLQAGGLRFNFFGVDGSGSNVTETATSLQRMGVRYPAAACPL